MSDPELNLGNARETSSPPFHSFTSSQSSDPDFLYGKNSQYQSVPPSYASTHPFPSPPTYTRYRPSIPPNQIDVSTITNEEWRKIETSVSSWLQSTRYEISTEEKRPFFKVANVSLIAGIFTGFTTNFLLKKYIPANKTIFPHWLPSIFLGFSAAQLSVHALRKRAYEKILQMETPLGDAARASLLDKRNANRNEHNIDVGSNNSYFKSYDQQPRFDKYEPYLPPPPNGYGHTPLTSSSNPVFTSSSPNFSSDTIRREEGERASDTMMNNDDFFRKENFSDESFEGITNSDFGGDNNASGESQKRQKDGYRSWDDIRRGTPA